MQEWIRGLSRRPRSVRCPATDALAPPRSLPVRARAAVRGRTLSRTVRVRLRINGSAPTLRGVLVTQQVAGYNGILWVRMGFHGIWRISAAVYGRPMGANGPTHGSRACG